jgi:hypothetical protein
MGWLNDAAASNNAAIRFAIKNCYMNVVGSVLGTPGKSNKYEALAGQSYSGGDMHIWVPGISSTGGEPDFKVAETVYRHGNYDYETLSTVWNPAIPSQDLPASLYLSEKPDWWCQEIP